MPVSPFLARRSRRCPPYPPCGTINGEPADIRIRGQRLGVERGVTGDAIDITYK